MPNVAPRPDIRPECERKQPIRATLGSADCPNWAKGWPKSTKSGQHRQTLVIVDETWPSLANVWSTLTKLHEFVPHRPILVEVGSSLGSRSTFSTTLVNLLRTCGARRNIRGRVASICAQLQGNFIIFAMLGLSKDKPLAADFSLPCDDGGGGRTLPPGVVAPPAAVLCASSVLPPVRLNQRAESRAWLVFFQISPSPQTSPSRAASAVEFMHHALGH